MNCRLHAGQSPDAELRTDSGGAEEGARPELVLAGLLVLMDAYRCAACPKLATCVANHLRTLAAHPAADPVLRQLSGRMEGAWRRLAGSPAGASLVDAPVRNGLLQFFSTCRS